MASFQDRLKEVIGPNGYDPSMRRSVQSAIMFEAHRCVKEKLDSMRPFQRKIAFFNQATALLDTLDFIPLHLRVEIMWRTGTSREQMTPDIGWKRSRLMDRELFKLAEKVKPHMEEGKSHAEACDAMVQELYEESSRDESNSAKLVPPNWEHAHNNVLMTFRMYYKGDKLDPDFPEPKPPVPVVAPSERPPLASNFLLPPVSGTGPSMASFPVKLDNTIVPPPTVGGNQHSPLMPPSSSNPDPVEDRQKVLAEVRDHLELLKQFEGVIPAEEINRRKRELFLALPPAPPPISEKRTRL